MTGVPALAASAWVSMSGRLVGRPARWISSSSGMTGSARPIKTPGECLTETLACGRQCLGDHARLRCDSHEVGVPFPSWQHVQVVVFLHSRAGRLAKIHAHVDAIRLVGVPQRLTTDTRKLHQLGSLLL